MNKNADEAGSETIPPMVAPGTMSTGPPAAAAAAATATQEYPPNPDSGSSGSSGVAGSVGSPPTEQADAPSGDSNHDDDVQRKVWRRINDATAYLDKVESTVSYKPQLFHDFLDLVNDTDEESLCPARMVERIASLFRDHIELIVGFNAFLPRGWKVEVLPGGEQLMLTMPHYLPAGWKVQVLRADQMLDTPTSQNVPTGSPLTNPTQLPVVVPEVSVAPEEVGGRADPMDNAPVEPPFASESATSPIVNLAVQFVDKVKRRYEGRPDKFKVFLDLLHTWQKNQGKVDEEGAASALLRKHLLEAELYQEMVNLFDDQEDLLQEFVQFLTRDPEGSGTSWGTQSKEEV